MHPRVLAERNEAAQASILAAADRLGAKFGLDGELEAIRVARRFNVNLGPNGTEARTMMEREAVAALLARVADRVCEAVEKPADPTQPIVVTVTAPEREMQTAGLVVADADRRRMFDEAAEKPMTAPKPASRTRRLG